MEIQQSLINLFEKWSGEKVVDFIPLPESTSARKYYRIGSGNKRAIGAFNCDLRENRAFIYLAKHFRRNGLHVPAIYSAELKNNIYLVEDLGDTTLFSLINKNSGAQFDKSMVSVYKDAIEELPRFQINGSKKLDYSYCYPRARFDRRSMMWDLNYFKYYFLKLAGIRFDEQKLEDDFITLTSFLLRADSNYFLYRDFNSRNIMITDRGPYFIDFQGGRKGPLQYDIASILFDSNANIPQPAREELLNVYIAAVRKTKPVKRIDFLRYYHGYILIRLLQMFGAYGFRGYFEGKAHFLKSIPLTVKDLVWLLPNLPSSIRIPELITTLDLIIASSKLPNFDQAPDEPEKLTVRITSFSYRDRIPPDFSGNGGGFIFDCRAIPNPGRYPEYKTLNGTDKPVRDFLEAQPEVRDFLTSTFSLAGQSVEKYISNKWTSLMISYGCTGGQHRSVYSAEKLGRYLREKYNVNVIVHHSKLKSK